MTIAMFRYFHALAIVVANLFKSRRRLEAENVLLRHQLNVDRYRPLGICGTVSFGPWCAGRFENPQPETVIRWHRAGFRGYWRWKSRARGGRPRTSLAIRQLIRDMSIANPLWGAPRIHGELLMLGIEVGQTTVARYMVRPR
jgi:hypothetical protein